jgi:hypothetical protein
MFSFFNGPYDSEITGPCRANNHFRGQAALNALELRFGLLHARIPVPPPLLSAYPELEALTRQ